MMSKQLKSWKIEKEPTTIAGKIWEEIKWEFKMNLYYPVAGFFSRYYEYSCRSLAFARFGWGNYDFDGAYLYEMMSFKMKRLYKVLENGHVIQEDEDMKALLEAIDICKRLSEGDYEMKYYYKHIEIYPHGEIGAPKPKITKEQATKRYKSFEEVVANGERDRYADLDRLNEIFKKHFPSWWD